MDKVISDYVDECLTVTQQRATELADASGLAIPVGGMMSLYFNPSVKQYTSPAFTGMKIDALDGFLKATSGVVGIGIPATIPPIELNFAYGDVSPSIITIIDTDIMVTEVSIIILIPFDGVGASLSIGDVGNHFNLMSTSQNDPTVIATYTAFPGLVYGAPTSIYLYITPGAGATAGSGVVLVTIND